MCSAKQQSLPPVNSFSGVALLRHALHTWAGELPKGAAMMPSNTESDFWIRVNKNGPVPSHMPHLGKCWIWGGAKDKDGYGRFPIGNATRIAHRAAYLFRNGTIPEGFLIMHKCDNPSCVNPDHLACGTPKDNSQDMVSKRRSLFTVHPEKCPRGEKHFLFGKIVNQLPGIENPSAKLTEAQVLEIRATYSAGGISQKKLAARYGVTQPLIGYIVRRELWKHI